MVSRIQARESSNQCPVISADLSRINSDVTARLSSIETLLSRLVSTLPAQPTHSFANIASTSNHSSPDVLTLTASGEEIFHPQSRVDGTPRQPLPQKPPPSGLFPSSLHATGIGRSGYGWGLREGRMINLTEDESPELKTLLATLKESGISKGHLEWVIAGVPGRRMADGLVELYFRLVTILKYLLLC